MPNGVFYKWKGDALSESICGWLKKLRAIPRCGGQHCCLTAGGSRVQFQSRSFHVFPVAASPVLSRCSGFLPTVQDMQARLTGYSKISRGVIPCLSLIVKSEFPSFLPATSETSTWSHNFYVGKLEEPWQCQNACPLYQVKAMHYSMY